MPKVSQKSPQELYQERLKRVNDCLAMKVPDRVPLEIAFGYFPARYYPGITCETAYYDYDKWLAASKKVVTGLRRRLEQRTKLFPGTGAGTHRSQIPGLAGTWYLCLAFTSGHRG